MANLYMRRPTTPDVVEAEQVGVGAQSHPQGARPARPGDWIVTNHATGETSTLTNEEFIAQYAPMAIPTHMDPTQAAPESQEPQATAPVPQQEGYGYQETFSPSGPTTPMNAGLENQPTTAPTQVRTTESGPIEADEESLATEPAVESPPEEASPTQPPPVSSNP